MHITRTILKIALKSWTKLSDDRLLNLLASDAPPPESPYKCKKVETNSTQAQKKLLFL